MKIPPGRTDPIPELVEKLVRGEKDFEVHKNAHALQIAASIKEAAARTGKDPIELFALVTPWL